MMPQQDAFISFSQSVLVLPLSAFQNRPARWLTVKKRDRWRMLATEADDLKPIKGHEIYRLSSVPNPLYMSLGELNTFE